MKWIGQNIYDQVSKFRNTVDFSEDVTFYQPVNNADPKISVGSSDDERMLFTVLYKGTTTQTAQINSFRSFTESGTAHDGRFEFNVDETHILKIQDGGIDFYAGKGISINGHDILTDNGSGVATLNNIDALDATTISTFNDALTAGDITGVTAGDNLSGGGTSGAVTINLADASTSAKGAASFSSDNFAASSGAITIKDEGIDLTAEVTGVLPSANMDGDTAHKSGAQTFTGAKTFALPIISDGNRTIPTIGDGAAIHVDAFDVTDGTTSASATTAAYRHVSIEAPRLMATNLSVTTTNAATLYVTGAPVASTNQTITNNSALWVDSGKVRFDETLTVGGTITGNVTGDLTGEADTVATIAGLAPNTATTQATQAAITTCANLVTVGTIGTGVWNATAIASAKMATGTASAQGALELATTGEADTGTDTARAVTPAGLKSHVDTRYAYSYMTWSASATSSMDGSDPEWKFPNTAKGIYEEDFTKDENIKATSVGATTFTTTRQTAVNALVIPHTGVCVGFHAHGRNDDSDASFKAGLFHYDGSTTSATNATGIDYGATGATHECTLRWIATANEAEASGGTDGTGGAHSFKGPCKLVSNVTNTFAVTAGDALLPAIMGPDASDEIFITMSIILKIPLA